MAWDLSYCFFLVRTSITYCEDFCLSFATWGNQLAKLTPSMLWEILKILELSAYLNFQALSFPARLLYLEFLFMQKECIVFVCQSLLGIAQFTWACQANFKLEQFEF